MVDVGQYGVLAKTVAVTTIGTTPCVPYDPVYAPNGVTVDVLFLPAGQSDWSQAIVQPAYWTQPQTVSAVSSANHVQPNGTAALWRLAWSPQTQGTYQARSRVTDSNGTSLGAITTYGVGPPVSTDHGPLRVSAAAKQEIEHADGTYRPCVGHNLGVQQTIPTGITTAGIDLVRVWLNNAGLFGAGWAPGGSKSSPWQALHVSDNDHVCQPTPSGTSAPSTFGFHLGGTSVGGDGDTQAVFSFNSWSGPTNGLTMSCQRSKKYRFQYTVRTSGVDSGAKVTLKLGGFPGTPLSTWLANGANVTTIVNPATGGTGGAWTTYTGTYTTGSAEDYFGHGTYGATPYLFFSLEGTANGFADICNLTCQLDVNGDGSVYGPNQFDMGNGPLDQISQTGAALVDALFADAASKGVAIQALLIDKSEISFAYLHADGTLAASSPNDVRLYGTEGSTAGSIDTTAAGFYQKAYLRYVVARWGASSALGLIEHLNEGGQTPALQGSWTNQLAQYVHGLDPSRHLFTTSHQSDGAEPTFYASMPDLDVWMVHKYLNGSGLNDSAGGFNLGLDTAQFHLQWSAYVGFGTAGGPSDRPSFVGEADPGYQQGSSPANPDTQTPQTAYRTGLATDTNGKWLHLWQAAVRFDPRGLRNLRWNLGRAYNDATDLVDANNLWARFADTAPALASIPINNGAYADAAATVSSGAFAVGRKDTTHQRAHLWVCRAGYTFANTPTSLPANGGTVGVALGSGAASKSFTASVWAWDSTVTRTTQTQTLTADGSGNVSLALSSLPAGTMDAAVTLAPVSTIPTPSSTASAASTNSPRTALAKQKLDRLSLFTNFLLLPAGPGQSSQGFIGEVGWPNNADQASWNAVAGSWYEAADGLGEGPAWGANKAYGVVNVTTTAQIDEIKAAGLTHAVLVAQWSTLQLSAGAAIDSTGLANLQALITHAQSIGVKVMLELALHYTPTWVQSAVVPFKAQDGSTWSGSFGGGDAVRDWIWTQTGRGYVSDFLTKMLAALTLSQIDCVRIGGGIYGELQAPPVGGGPTFMYWAFGAAEQSGTDLAAGMSVCPVPGYTPFTGDATKDQQWSDWWLAGWNTWLQWQITLYQTHGWTGTLYVMHPSYGMRSNYSITTPTTGYAQALAQAQDWDRFIAGYAANAQVWPYCTWIDDRDFSNDGAHDPYKTQADSDLAAWRKLFNVAKAHNKHALIWGENTATSPTDPNYPNTNANMDWVVQQACALGYRGLNWLNAAELDSGAGATWAHFGLVATAPRPALHVTGWASGRDWGTGYNLGQYVNGTGGGNLDTAQSPTSVLEAHLTFSHDSLWAWRGTNLSGADFGASGGYDNAHPGTYGVDWVYPSLADWQYVYGRGVRIVRLPFLWERIQPTLGAALNVAEVGRLQTALANAAAAGLQVVLDLHNYARYQYDISGSPVTLVLDQGATGIDTTNGRLAPSYLVDVWERISDAVVGSPALLAYDLMNEPHDLPPVTGVFSGTEMYNWNTSTQGWNPGDGSTTLTANGALGKTAAGDLRITKTGSTGAFITLRADDATQRLNDPGSGNVLAVWVQIAAGTTGTWAAHIEWQTAGFAWQNNGSTTYQDASGNPLSSVIPGQWVQVISDFTAHPISGPLAYAVQVESQNPPVGTIVVDVDDFQRGTPSGGALSSVAAWETITQTVLTALRTAKSDGTTIIVPGHGWNVEGWMHPAKWITEPTGSPGTHWYATHQYWDTGSSGTYGGSGNTYAVLESAAQSAGFADDPVTLGAAVNLGAAAIQGVGALTGALKLSRVALGGSIHGAGSLAAAALSIANPAPPPTGGVRSPAGGGIPSGRAMISGGLIL